MNLAIGSLCSGYGGLDLAVESFFGARTAWFSEFDPAPSKVLARHWPGVPNLGDMTRIDWATVEPVDIIAGGTPCPDLSVAGKRAGMTEGTRSNLWVQMREAIAVIKPSYVIWENVRGAYSAYAVSEVESETGLLGGYGTDRPALRALGRVLGDFSDLGYDAQWVGVRASDVGAPHGRFRVFVLAHAASGGSGVQHDRPVCDETRRGRDGVADRDCRVSPVADPESVVRGLRNTINEWSPGGEINTFGDSRNAGGWAVGTQAPITDSENFGHERAGSTRGRRNGFENHRHTLTDTDHTGCSKQRGAVTVQPEHTPTEHGSVVDWGVYEPAIRRWQQVLGRTAPAPTEPTGKGGAHRLSARFVEWMMGAEPGWVTDPVIGLTRNQQLKALGNGVVTLQAEYALSILFQQAREAAA